MKKPKSVADQIAAARTPCVLILGKRGPIVKVMGKTTYMVIDNRGSRTLAPAQARRALKRFGGKP